MLSFLRAPLPTKKHRAADSPVVYENGKSKLEFSKAGSEYLLRGTQPPFSKDDVSILQPPMHFHLYQDEHFRIVSGTCHVFKDTMNKPWKTLDANDPDALKTATIPKMTYHSFHNASFTEPLTIDVKLTPEDAEREEQFFRNFFGYLDDCKLAGQEPSPFQLMVFLKSSDTPLAFPIGIRGNIILQNVMAWWGSWMLGYKTSYPEYAEGKKYT